MINIDQVYYNILKYIIGIDMMNDVLPICAFKRGLSAPR